MLLTKQAIRSELWERGEPSFLFHSGQDYINQVFNNYPHAVVVFNISRQWGKTVFAAVKAVEKALQVPGAKVRYGTAFETDLVEFAIPAFEFVLETCQPHLRPKWIEQKKKFIFPKVNGKRSEIKLVGLDRKPNGLRGNKIDLIILDEAGFISRLHYLHKSVIVPLTTHRPDAKILIMSTPPESPDHPFWDFVDRAKLEGSYCEFTIDENPLLTISDIQRLEREMGGRNSTEFQREYLCKRIVEASRAITPEWNSEIMVGEPDRHEFWPYYQRVEAMDIGVRLDLTVTLFATYAFKEAKLYIHDVISMNGPDMTTDKLALEIKNKETEFWPKPFKQAVLHRVADNSHPLLVNDLSLIHDLTFAEIEKGTLNEMVNEARIWIRDGRVIVSPKAKLLIGSLESGIWDEKRKEFSRSKVYGHYDPTAALIYLIRYVIQGIENYNPVPKNANRSVHTHFFLPEKSMSENARELKRAFKR